MKKYIGDDYTFIINRAKVIFLFFKKKKKIFRKIVKIYIFFQKI